MSRGELDRVFNNTAMKKRTKRFAILGMSLSNLLDIHQAQDLLKGLLNTLSEYDQSKEESDKPKMVCFSPVDLPLCIDLYVMTASLQNQDSKTTSGGWRLFRLHRPLHRWP